MLQRLILGGICLLTSTVAVSVSKDQQPEKLNDIFFGEILYHAYQENYFTAISKLDTELAQFYALDEPELDPFHLHLDQAEFSIGDMELSYRMHNKAGRAIKALLNSGVSQSIRNDAAYRLGKLYYQKQLPVNALHALEKIKGDVPERIRADESFLRAQVYVANGKFKEAIELLKGLVGDPNYQGYVEFNLGMAYLQSSEEEKGIAQLASFGQFETTDKAVLAIKDKANLMLGYRLLEKNLPVKAKQFFERVRLGGPFSNRALLGAGWVDASSQKFERALVPWTLLHEREKTNHSVQESLLAVPYAYGKLKVHSKAALLYGEALEVFGKEIDRLSASIKSIREGKFLKALVKKGADKRKNWLVGLRDLPDAPETYYILDLMASNDFQSFLLNFKDMAALREQNESWLKSLTVYEELIAIRRDYYTPLLPDIQKQFKKLDSRMRLRIEQRARLDDRLKSMLISRRPEYLANVDERIILESIEKMKSYVVTYPDQATPEINSRIKRLKGVLDWQIHAEYDQRLTDAYNHLHLLDEHIDELNRVYKSFIRTRQAATQSYEGYDIPISQLRNKLNEKQTKLKGIMARQGRMIENMAANELDKRRARLESYQVKARFALAESYDRATQKANKVEGKPAVKDSAAKDGDKK